MKAGGPDWEEAVRTAKAAGVLEVADERIRFTHPLLAAGAYERLDAEARHGCIPAWPDW